MTVTGWPFWVFLMIPWMVGVGTICVWVAGLFS